MLLMLPIARCGLQQGGIGHQINMCMLVVAGLIVVARELALGRAFSRWSWGRLVLRSTGVTNGVAIFVGRSGILSGIAHKGRSRTRQKTREACISSH